VRGARIKEFVGETESRKMSGAKAGTAMMNSKEEGEFAVVRDGGRRPPHEKGVRSKCEESALRRRVIRDLRKLWTQLGFDGDTEVEDCREEAAKAVKDGEGMEDKYDVLLDMVLVEELEMVRRFVRTECLAHGWKAPDGSAPGRALRLQLCTLCEPGCGLDEEEARAMAAGRVVCGFWSKEEAAARLERLGGGGCCGNEWSAGGTV
jgi:hypothetical protein